MIIKCSLQRLFKLYMNMYFVKYGKGLIIISLCYSSVHQKRSEAEFSCVSMRSDASMNQPIDYKSEDTKTDLRSNISVKDYLIMIQNT